MAATRSVCPVCRRTYAAEVRVCKADGSALVDDDRLSADDIRARDPTYRGPAPPPRSTTGRTTTLPPRPAVPTTRNTIPPRSTSLPRSPAVPGLNATGRMYRMTPGPMPVHGGPRTSVPHVHATGQAPSDGTPPDVMAAGPVGAPPEAVDAGLIPPPPPAPGGVERLGPYRLLRQLGEGGMARIYLAEHEKLGRICAIKRLHADHFADRLTVARFLAEARAVGAIHHPNLVAAYDVVEEPHEIYLVMEYLDGRDVAQVLREEGPMTADRAAEIMAQACDGLAAVHAQNIIHRDLKPENIFLTRLPEGGERVKLLDFGVARLLGDRPQELRTRSGLTVGTPTYMSPEQATASEIDARSDIYTVGVVLYEMLSGAPPFTGAGYGDVMLMHVNDPPPRLSTRRADVPGWMEDIVMRCLEKEPPDRYPSATELAAALRAGVGRKPTPQPVGPNSKETRRVTTRVFIEPPPAQRPRWVVPAVVAGALALAGGAVAAIRASGGGPGRAGSGQLSTRVVHIASEPEGAQVLVDDAPRCTTPCGLEVQVTHESTPVTVRVVADGYAAEQRIIDTASPPEDLRFVLAAAPPGAPPGAPAPTPPTKKPPAPRR